MAKHTNPSRLGSRSCSSYVNGQLPRIRGLGLLWCAEHAGDLKIDCSSALLVRFLRLGCAGGRHWLLNNRGESHAAVRRRGAGGGRGGR